MQQKSCIIKNKTRQKMMNMKTLTLAAVVAASADAVRLNSQTES